MNKVNFVQAGTPEEFFAYVEKVKALHKAKAIADAPEKEPPTDEKLDSVIEEINEENS